MGLSSHAFFRDPLQKLQFQLSAERQALHHSNLLLVRAHADAFRKNFDQSVPVFVVRVLYDKPR